MKIAIYHDTLIKKGGAEKSVIELANYLNADLITSGYNTELSKWIKIKSKVIDIGNLTIKRSYVIGFNIEAPIRFYLNRNKYNYDVYIYSQFSSIFASKYENLNIWFCHTPNRILYDLKELRINRANIIKKILYILYIRFLLSKDQNAVTNMQEIIANSVTVQNRILKYYSRKSKVIYPSIEVNKYNFKYYGDYYLSVARLIPEKRVDLIARAFAKISYKNLIIVGDGTEKNKIIKIIEGHKNIKLITSVSEEQLKELYSKCLATVYMPLDEDFGLVPLESMAAGKPCIASNEGGCRETIIHGKTGLLINATELDLINTIKNFKINNASRMKINCINQAKKFDLNIELKLWKKELEGLQKKYK